MEIVRMFNNYLKIAWIVEQFETAFSSEWGIAFYLDVSCQHAAFVYIMRFYGIPWLFFLPHFQDQMNSDISSIKVTAPY